MQNEEITAPGLGLLQVCLSAVCPHMSGYGVLVLLAKQDCVVNRQHQTGREKTFLFPVLSLTSCVVPGELLSLDPLRAK